MGSPEQFHKDFNNEEETRETNEDEGGVLVFDDMPDYNQKAIDLFFTKEDTKIQMLSFYHKLILILLREQKETTTTYLICLNKL